MGKHPALLLAALLLTTLLIGAGSTDRWPGQSGRDLVWSQSHFDNAFSTDPAYFSLCYRYNEGVGGYGCYIPGGQALHIDKFFVVLGQDTAAAYDCKLTLAHGPITDAGAANTLISSSEIQLAANGDNDNCLEHAADKVLDTEGDYCTRVVNTTIVGPRHLRIQVTSHGGGGTCTQIRYVQTALLGTWSG